jgi:hypothetical protein
VLNDALKLFEDTELAVQGRVELAALAERGGYTGRGLGSLTEELLDGYALPKNKSVSLSNWEAMPLSRTQISYAALDVWAACQLHCRMLHNVPGLGRLMACTVLDTAVGTAGPAVAEMGVHDSPAVDVHDSRAVDVHDGRAVDVHDSPAVASGPLDGSMKRTPPPANNAFVCKECAKMGAKGGKGGNGTTRGGKGGNGTTRGGKGGKGGKDGKGGKGGSGRPFVKSFVGRSAQSLRDHLRITHGIKLMPEPTGAAAPPPSFRCEVCAKAMKSEQGEWAPSVDSAPTVF